MNDFSVTLVVGATNEEEALKQTVRYVMTHCPPQEIDRILIVYAKNAPAGCRSAIGTLETEFPDKVFGMEQIRPYVGGAIRDGFDTAVSSHILLLPGDLAIGLDAVPLLFEREKNAPDGIVKTSRWLNRNAFHGYGRLRKHLNALAQVFLRILYHTRLTDLTNPVQIMPSALYHSIDWRELNFPFLAEMVLCPLRLGAAFSEIPADCRSRMEGSSSNSFLQTALYLRTALRIRFTPKARLLKTDRKEKRAAVFARKGKRS